MSHEKGLTERGDIRVTDDPVQVSREGLWVVGDVDRWDGDSVWETRIWKRKGIVQIKWKVLGYN